MGALFSGSNPRILPGLNLNLAVRTLQQLWKHQALIDAGLKEGTESIEVDELAGGIDLGVQDGGQQLEMARAACGGTFSLMSRSTADSYVTPLMQFRG